MSMQKFVATLLCVMAPAMGQELSIAPIRPQANILLRPYLPVDVPPVRTTNPSRLADLIRAGRLYLTAKDAIALALENNIDLEVARYNPLAAEWRVERAAAGGALPGVTNGASQVSSVANGQGVLGSQAAAGVSIAGANSTGNHVQPSNAAPAQQRSECDSGSDREPANLQQLDSDRFS